MCDPLEDASSFWSSLGRAYERSGPPLRPSLADIQLIESALEAWRGQHPSQPLRALLLGVTPGLAEMRWPEPSTLLGVDNSMPMVRGVWPGDVPGRRRAVCASWLALPVARGAIHIVAGDGSINCVRYPDGFRALAESVSGVLAQDGIVAIRCFVQPPVQETPEDVFADIPRTPDFHYFKFRLLMSMQRDSRDGVAVDEVYRCWASHSVDRKLLNTRLGWEDEVIDTIELYKGKDTVHTFPTLLEVRSVFDTFFEETGCLFHSCPMGERCPVLVWRPRLGRRESQPRG